MPEPDSKTPPASIGRAVAIQALGHLTGPLSAIITAPILARALGTDGRGELAAAVAAMYFVTNVGLVGMQEAATYYVAQARHSIRRITLVASAIVGTLGAVATIAVLWTAPALASGDENLLTLMRIAACAVIPTFFVVIGRALASGTQRWRLVFWESSLTGLLKLAAFALLYVMGDLTSTWAVLVTVAAPVLAAFVYVPIVAGAIRSTSELPRSDPIFGPMLIFGSRVWLGSLGGVALSRLDQLVMVPMNGQYELGLYAIAVTIGEVPTIIAAATRSVVFATDSADTADPSDRHASSDAGRALTDRLQSAARTATFLTGIGAAVMAIPIAWWLPWVFGEDFRAAIPASLILLLATVVGTTGSVAGAGLGARNRPELRSWSMLIGAIGNVVVLLATVRAWGAVGGALSTLVGNAIAGNLNVWWCYRKFGMDLRGFFGIRRHDLSPILTKVRSLARGLRATARQRE